MEVRQQDLLLLLLLLPLGLAQVQQQQKQKGMVAGAWRPQQSVT
jgi:hypothetical protein